MVTLCMAGPGGPPHVVLLTATPLLLVPTVPLPASQHATGNLVPVIRGAPTTCRDGGHTCRAQKLALQRKRTQWAH